MAVFFTMLMNLTGSPVFSRRVRKNVEFRSKVKKIAEITPPLSDFRNNVLRQIKSVPEANCCVRKNRTEGDYYWGSH